MNIADKFNMVLDYISPSDVVDVITEHFTESEIEEFMDFLVDRYDIQMEFDDYSNEDEY